MQPVSRFMARTTLYHGIGAAKMAGGEAAKLGLQKVLIVTDQGVREAGLLAVVEDSFQVNTIAHDTFDEVPEDADVQTCREIAGILRQGYHGVVAVGGGSPICAAKGGAMEAANPHIQSILELAGHNQYRNPPLPVICLPTTAGSGSDVSAAFPIVDETHSYELAVTGDHVQPPVSILDANLLKTCPTRPMIYAGLDALSHAVEALWGPHATPLTDALASEAILLIMANLRAAVLTDDMEAKSSQHLAAAMANFACGNAGLGIVHGIASSISHIRAPHGLKCGMLLPFAIAFNMTVCEDKFARLAALSGEGAHGGARRALAEKFLHRIKALYRDLGFPTRFTPEQFKTEHVPALVKEIRRYSPAFLQSNRRRVTDEDIERIALGAAEGWDRHSLCGDHMEALPAIA